MTLLRIFESPFGPISCYKSRESLQNKVKSEPRSYDHQGQMYILHNHDCDFFAIDVEDFTQPIPNIFNEVKKSHRLNEPIDFYASWTVSEGISKLTGVPILVRLKEDGIKATPLNKMFEIQEKDLKFQGHSKVYYEEGMVISVVSKI